jgi:hypothetical protein
MRHDFKEMVRKAKIEAEAQASAGARTSSKQWNDEIAVLRKKAMPILKRACADFGTEVKIYWGTLHRLRPPNSKGL